jgi:hypothetical protein
MYPVNFYSIIASSFIPLFIGMIWYNPKVFGTIWMKASGVDPEAAQKSSMILVFGLTWIFSLFVAFILGTMVVHQTGVFGVLVGQTGFPDDVHAEASKWYAEFMELYGNNYRSFQHGALHGALAGLFFALPVIGINALFDGRPWQYILVNTGYWVVCLLLMGGLICSWV